MRPVSLTIHGDWWDSFIYAGSLYLLRIDGSAKVVPWVALIEDLIERFKLDRLAMELAFIDARYLYGEQWSRLVRDSEIRSVIDRKFERLSESSLEVTEHDLKRVGASDARGLGPELTADVEIHRSVMYFAAEDGLSAQHRTLARQGERARRIWDSPLFRVKASGGVLALAAGKEGLYQSHALVGHDWNELREPDRVVVGDFFSCAWLSANIFGSSYTNAGTLAVFSQQRDTKERRVHRVFEAAVPDAVLFDAPQQMREIRADGGDDRAVVDPPGGRTDDATNIVFDRHSPAPAAVPRSADSFSWAGQDRVCQARGNEVRVAVYSARRRRLRDRFTRLPSKKIDGYAAVTAGDVAPFGVVVESQDNLHVLADEGVWELGYEPTRWRSFPRATNYPNHLHIVGDDRLEICSFLTAALEELGTSRPWIGRASRRPPSR